MSPTPFPGRVAAHAGFLLVVWLALTVMTAALEAIQIPYFDISLENAVAGAAVGLVILMPDLLLATAVFLLISVPIFRRFGIPADGRQSTFHKLLREPAVTFIAILFGVVIWYPAVSSQTLFLALARVPTGLIPVLLAFGVAGGAWLTARRGCGVRLAITLLALGVLLPVPALLRAQTEGRSGARSDLVLLGLDSLSHHDDVQTLNSWTAANGGAWYQYAVAPGLVTNSVWASVMTMRPVNDHGIFHAFQHFPESTATLVYEASTQGYRTVSLFPDQSTCEIGSAADFDVDHSGPRGWRQTALSIVENNSILLPILKPLLPRVWPSPAPPNHSGTFTYDLDRDLREALLAGDGRSPTFVAAHLTYLHNSAYPRYIDLSWEEVRRVLFAPARSVRDRSFDWQDEDRPDDPIPLRRWKVARLQSAVVTAIAETRFLEGRGRLILFSDHGDRVGLTTETFTDPRYHHVLLATFGVKPRQSLTLPISLIDVGTLAGIVARPPADPIVEFTLAPSEQWPLLVKAAHVRWSGAVDLDPRQLSEIFATLHRHRPWTGHEGH